MPPPLPPDAGLRRVGRPQVVPAGAPGQGPAQRGFRVPRVHLGRAAGGGAPGGGLPGVLFDGGHPGAQGISCRRCQFSTNFALAHTFLCGVDAFLYVCMRWKREEILLFALCVAILGVCSVHRHASRWSSCHLLTWLIDWRKIQLHWSTELVLHQTQAQASMLEELFQTRPDGGI